MAEKTGQTGQTLEQIKAAYESALMSFAGSDSAKQRMVMQMLNTGLNLGAGFMDLGIANSQKRYGEQLRSEIQTPEMFTPTRDTTLLDGRIQNQMGLVNDVRQDLAPAELANLDQYLADIGNARIASGGQASQFAPQGNAAALRRRRGGLEIAALGSGIKRQNRGELDKLIGMNLADRNQWEQRKIEANKLSLDKYYRETTDAATLESAGRQNQRDSIYNMIPSISGLGQGIGMMSRTSGNNGQGMFGNVGDWWRQRQTRRAARKGVPVIDFNGSSSDMRSQMYYSGEG